jgi:hypothetical protein
MEHIVAYGLDLARGPKLSFMHKSGGAPHRADSVLRLSASTQALRVPGVIWFPRITTRAVVVYSRVLVMALVWIYPGDGFFMVCGFSYPSNGSNLSYSLSIAALLEFTRSMFIT